MKLYDTLTDMFADLKDRDREILFIDGEKDESAVSFGDLWERALALLGVLTVGLAVLLLVNIYQHELTDRVRGRHGLAARTEVGSQDGQGLALALHAYHPEAAWIAAYGTPMQALIRSPSPLSWVSM